MSLLVACLNGARTPADSPVVPLTPESLAAEAVAAREAGADEVHVHPRDDSGRESLRPEDVAAAVQAVREAAPGLPVSGTTSASAQADPDVRHWLVAAWTALPDLASVNWHEPGAPELAALLVERGVGVEAGLWTPEAASAFVADPVASRCVRVLVEPMDTDPNAALATAHAVLSVLDRAGVRLPRLLHGEGAPAWAVLDAALGLGLDVRIGLEDTLTGPEGRPATNPALVSAAAARVRERVSGAGTATS